MKKVLLAVKKLIKDWKYRKFFKRMAKMLVFSETPLLPKHLEENGWILEGEYWIQPNIKDRDRIYIKFDGSTYLVRHSDKMTFIAREKSLEWFETYYLLIHPDNGRYELAGV